MAPEHDPEQEAARLAARILTVLRDHDAAAIEAELARAAGLCREAGGEPAERVDLLAAIIEDIRRAQAVGEAHAKLLAHLARLT
jgi:hypothetical protein